MQDLKNVSEILSLQRLLQIVLSLKPHVQWLFKVMQVSKDFYDPSPKSQPLQHLIIVIWMLGNSSAFTTDFQAPCNYVIVICNLPWQFSQKINGKAGREGCKLLDKSPPTLHCRFELCQPHVDTHAPSPTCTAPPTYPNPFPIHTISPRTFPNTHYTTARLLNLQPSLPHIFTYSHTIFDPSLHPMQPLCLPNQGATIYLPARLGPATFC